MEREFLGLAVSHDCGGDPDHRFELGGCCVRAGLLNETQRQPQYHHHQHDGARNRIALRRHERDDRQNCQQDHQRVARGNVEPLQPSVALLARDLIRAVLFQARGCHLRSQALERCFHQPQDIGAVEPRSLLQAR